MRSPTILIILTALVLQGCAMGGGVDTKIESGPVESRSSYQLDDSLTAKERFRKSLILLESGQPQAARIELVRFLQDQPNSGIARSLLKQIDTPIAEFFPMEYQEVTLQSGESLSTLAKNYLGSVYLFHALARYNGIAEPRKLTAGQTIRIPLTEHAEAALAAGPSQNQETEEVTEPAELNESLPEPGVEAEPAVVESVVPRAAAEVEAQEIEAIEEALETDTSTSAKVEAIHREALNAYRAQDLDKAISLWDEVLALDPEHENARLYRSQALELRKKLSNIP